MASCFGCVSVGIRAWHDCALAYGVSTEAREGTALWNSVVSYR
jgi:hypothetical protein